MSFYRIVKPFPDGCHKKHASAQGFALVIALGLMAFVLLLVLTMTTLVQVETGVSANQKQLLRARQNALLGVQLALGQLQKEMGPDRRISATASLLDTDPETEAIEGVGQPYWTGVWDSLNWDRASQLNAEVSSEATASNGKPGSFRGWLVSGFSDSNLTAEELIAEARNFTSASTDAVQLLGEGTLGTTVLAQAQSVYARREALNEGSATLVENGYAFWVGDEGVKARFGHDLETPEDELGRIHQVSSLGNPNFSSFSGWDSFSSIDTEISEKVMGYPSLNIVLSEELGSTDALDEKYHSISPYTVGLLSDVRTGGLRKDLSLLFGSAIMPTDYNNQPLFEVGDASGPNWEYLKRYFSRYEMLEVLPSGDASLNILDVKPEVEDALEPEKPGDAPIPVIARFQYIFSMYQGYNTLDGMPYDGPAGPGTDYESDDKIVYLMVTPVIYVWNPYNVTMRMPLDSKAAMNILTAFPPLELSFDGGGTYKRFDKMFWFYQGTLIALQTSNTSTEELIIPPGEMRVNTLGDYNYMSKLYLFYGASSNDPGLEDFFGTNVQAVNPRGGYRNQEMASGFSEGTMGLFSPALLPGTRPASADTKLLASGSASIKVRFDPTATKFLFKTNVGGEGGGQRQQAGVFHVNSPSPIADTYLPSEYEHPETVSLSGLSDMLDGSGNFTGLDPLFIVNYDVRAFDEVEGIGKPGLFTDPTNGYFYTEEADEKAVALSPFRVTFEEAVGSGDYIQYDPITERAGLKVGTDVIQYNVAKEIPAAPMLSIAQFENAPLGRDYQHLIYQNVDFDSTETPPSVLPQSNPERRNMAPVFNRAVGNSFQHPMIPADRVWDNAYAVDRSYLLNDVLFDSYFFSGVSDEAGPFDTGRSADDILSAFLDNADSLPNSNYKLVLPDGYTLEDAEDILAGESTEPDELPFERIAAFLAVDGAFNINSTSVDAWSSVLSALKGKSAVYTDRTNGGYTAEVDDDLVPVLSSMVPAGPSAEQNGADYISAYATLWNGFRSLNATQIRELSQHIVRQVKARGPFLSLSQFVNREISSRGEYNQSGAIQSAIDLTSLNVSSDAAALDVALNARFDSGDMDTALIDDAGFPSAQALYGNRNEGMPGYLNQAQILKPLAPVISARSDTFVIRAYGDVKKSGQPVAKAWCEVVVQRRTEYVSDDTGVGLEPWETPSPNTLADQFGRQLKLVSFRWLDAEEI